MLPILLAMQAAGMVTDWFGVQEQKRLGGLGAKVEQAAITSNIEMTRLQAEDASLQAMKQLRQNLGTQAAMNAARGTRGNAGSAVAFTQESLRNFGSDEQARRMNLLSKEAELRASGVLSGLHQLTSETQLGQQLTKGIFNNLPISALADKVFPSASSTGAGSNTSGAKPFSSSRY